MRTLRLSLAGAVILALLGSVSGAVLAQDDTEDQARVAHVTGKLIDQVWDDTQLDFTTEAGVNYGRGMRLMETYEWSDPRLPALKTSILNFNSYPSRDAERGIMTQLSNRMEGPDGAWVGTATSMQFVDGRGQGQDIYVGEGAYEGLVAVMFCDSEGCEGQIFEGELPPVPDPVEPSAE
jgi:hypothetical protein